VEDGDAVGFCRRVQPRLIGALTLYCGDRLLAEELAQDTLVRVLDRWETVQAMAAPEAWAHRVAINLANSAFRRRGAERRARQRAQAAAQVPPGVEDHDARLMVRRAVATLPERQRQVVVLRYIADLPIEEVARLMRCAPGTVKSLTNRAVTALSTSEHLDLEGLSDHA